MEQPGHFQVQPGLYVSPPAAAPAVGWRDHFKGPGLGPRRSENVADGDDYLPLIHGQLNTLVCRSRRASVCPVAGGKLAVAAFFTDHWTRQ